MGDPIRVVRIAKCCLTLWETGFVDWRGQPKLAYRLTYRGRAVFCASDFAGSPMYENNSDETVAGLLGYLSLRPGDTDKEYFDCYFPAQMRFVEDMGEELAAASCDRFGER